MSPLTVTPGPGASDRSGDTILRRLRRYLQLHRHATLGDLALHFGVPPEAMRGMLDMWIRKGRLRELDQRATCNSSCPTACDDTAMTVFEWVESGSGPTGSFTALPLLQPTTPSGGTCRQHP